MGSVQFRRPVAQGSRARGHGQGRRPVVRGPCLSRRRPVAGQSEPDPFVGVRVLGRLGARDEPLRGEVDRRHWFQSDAYESNPNNLKNHTVQVSGKNYDPIVMVPLLLSRPSPKKIKNDRRDRVSKKKNDRNELTIKTTVRLYLNQNLVNNLENCIPITVVNFGTIENVVIESF